DDVSECEERHCRRYNEESNTSRACRQPLPQGAGDLLFGTEGAGHRRQLSHRNRHAEQANREQVEGLGIQQGRNCAGRKEAGEEGIDISAELYYSASDEDRNEVAEHGADIFAERGEEETDGRGQSKHERKLHQELKSAAYD